MGLRSWLKRSAGSSAATAHSPEQAATAAGAVHAKVPAAAAPATAVPGATPAEPDFDALIAAAKKNEPEAMDALWRAVYAMPSWFFIHRGPFPGPPTPCCWESQGRPFMCAFTSEKRALAWANQQNIRHEGTEAVPILSMARDAAIGTALAAGKHGLFGVMFNLDSEPFFAPLTNLVPMHSHYTGTLLETSALRFKQDPFDVLHARLRQTNADAHFAEAVAHVFRQPTWYFLASREDRAAIFTWKIVEKNHAVTAVFTTPERAAQGALDLKLVKAEEDTVPTLALPAAQALDLLHSLAQQGQLDGAILNLQIPVAAGVMKEYRDVLVAEGRL